MLSLFTKDNPSHTEKTESMEQNHKAPDHIEAEELSAALEQVAKGTYEDIQCSNPVLQPIIQSFVNQLEQQQRKLLSGNVELSMTLSESVIAGAEMNDSSIKTNAQISSMAGATEELSCSVNEIAQNTEEVNNDTISMNDILN